ncbi:M16 family metallopeptidase [Psychrobacter lutiphocae]|uniref:M16 family metallopeptidase n=1 Tax=Psychrobacter lutiphocae TaxID=540500 RepID=UPI000382157F|nr:pitrilysin family protein [Psychrobacter lutiphocae]
MTLFLQTLKTNKATFKRPLFSLQLSLLAPAVVVAGISLSSNLQAATVNMPDGEHGNKDVDISQPIAALDKLTSLQHSEKLDMKLPEFQRFTTSNGVPVLFFQTNQLPIVDVDLRFNAGSARDESIRKGGFGLASLVASQLTKGTKQLDETQFATATEQLGIELTSSAYKDQFLIRLRSLSDSKQLNPALQLMNTVINEPRFDPQVLKRSQAQQILGLKQMLQNPAYIASTTFSEHLYGNHPYAHSSYGTVDSVGLLSTADLKKFHDTYLVANNASLSLTGDLSLAEAKQVAETLTKDLPLGKPAPKLPSPTPLQASQWVHVDFDSDQTSVIIGQQGYRVLSDPASIEKSTQFAIGNDVLAGSGFHSRLMGKVRKELGYTYGIYGSMTPMQVNGPYSIRFSSRNEVADDAIKATLDTVTRTLTEGISKEEFELTKESLVNSYPMGFSSNAGINGMLGMLNFNKLPDNYITGYIDRVENTSLPQVNETLKQTLTPNKFLIVTVGKPKIAEDSPLKKLQ